MEGTAKTLTTLGVLFLLGVATDILGTRTRLPRVTLLMILGFAIGPVGLGFLSSHEEKWFHLFADIALVMIGFLLGERLTLSSLRRHGKFVLWFSVAEVVATAVVVFGGLLLAGIQTEIALLLAGIATATDPAATMDVVHQTRSQGVFTRTLMGIVAVDDAWGLIVFSLVLTLVQTLNGQGEVIAPLIGCAWDIGGAFIVGVGLGIPMAFLTGRIRPGEPTLVEALGIVLLCGGISIWLEVSFLIASMVLGTVVANVARHHTRPFHAIEGIEWPFMILFFMLAGASLHIEAVYGIGVIGLAYIILRFIGRISGSWVAGALSHAKPLLRNWMGFALMPQAGVALGMALVVAQRRPDLGEVILPVVIGSTVLFEVFGPILTRSALVRSGEVKSA